MTLNRPLKLESLLLFNLEFWGGLLSSIQHFYYILWKSIYSVLFFIIKANLYYYYIEKEMIITNVTPLFFRSWLSRNPAQF